VLYPSNDSSELFCDGQTLAVKERAWDVPSSSLQPSFGSQDNVTTEMSNQMPPQWYPTSHVSANDLQRVVFLTSFRDPIEHPLRQICLGPHQLRI